MHSSMYVRMPVWLYIYVLCSCVFRVSVCSCVPVYASVYTVSRITVTDCMFYYVPAQQDERFVRIVFFLRSLQDDKGDGYCGEVNECGCLECFVFASYGRLVIDR